MDAVLVSQTAHVVTGTGHGFTTAPAVGLRVIDLVPTHTGTLFGGGRRATNQVHFAIHGHGSGGAPGPWHRCNSLPLVTAHVIPIGIGIRIAVLLSEAPKSVDSTVQGNHRHMVGATRQGGCVVPHIGGRVVHMVIAPIHTAFTVTANDVQTTCPLSGPSHFAAGNRQSRPGHPTTHRPFGSRAFKRTLGRLIRRQMVCLATLQSRIGLGRRGQHWQFRMVMMRGLPQGGIHGPSGRSGQEDSAIHWHGATP